MKFGQEMDISINIKQKYNVRTSVGTLLKPRNRVPPRGPPPFQYSIIKQAHKDMGDEHKWFYQQGQRDSDSSIWH